MTQLQNFSSSPAAPSLPPQRRRIGFVAGVRRLAGFFAWIFTGFGLLPAIIRRKGGHFKVQEIVVYSVHRSFFLWALILIGFVGSAIVRSHPGAAHALGWIYVWVLIY